MRSRKGGGAPACSRHALSPGHSWVTHGGSALGGHRRIMAACLERPILSERIQLPGKLPNGGSLAVPEVTPGDFGASRSRTVAQMFSKNCSGSSTQVRPNLTGLGQTSPRDLGQSDRPSHIGSRPDSSCGPGAEAKVPDCGALLFCLGAWRKRKGSERWVPRAGRHVTLREHVAPWSRESGPGACPHPPHSQASRPRSYHPHARIRLEPRAEVS